MSALLGCGMAFAQSDQMGGHAGHHMMSEENHVSCTPSSPTCGQALTPVLLKDGKLGVVWSVKGGIWFAKSDRQFQSNQLVKQANIHFSEAIQIADQKTIDLGGDARPQIVQDNNGLIHVYYAFFKDADWNAQINHIVSVDGGKHFKVPEALALTDSSQRFPQVLRLQNGQIFLTWLDKRIVRQAKLKGETKLGASLAYSYLDDQGNLPVQSSQGMIANFDTCECCRIGVATTQNQQVLAIYRAIFPGGIRDHAVQLLGKGSFGEVERVSNDEWKTDVCPHHGPSVAVSAKGTIYAAWFTQGTRRQGVFYAISRDSGKHFSDPIKLGSDDDVISRPNLIAKGSLVWLVWKRFNGKESSIVMRASADDGQTWSSDQVLSSTKGYSDHPLLVNLSNQIYLSWLTRDDGYQLISLGGD